MLDPAAVETRVRDIIAEVTRYPREILAAHADLEDDLGVDSVKQAEIMAVLSQELGIEASPPATGSRNELRTIRDVVAYVAARARAGGPFGEERPGGRRNPGEVEEGRRPPPIVDSSPAAAAPRTSVERAGATSPPRRAGVVERSAADVAPAIRGIFAEVTRYPEELLTDEADFEDELGIDSVKQAEIAAHISQRFPEAGDLDPRRESLRTLAEVIRAVLARSGPGSADDPPSVVGANVTRGFAPGRAASPVSPVRVECSDFRAEPQPPQALLGKVALVTGSGRGLGKTIVSHLARLGAQVIVNSFHSREAGERTAEELRAEGHRALHIWGSVSNPAHLDRLFAEVERAHGGLDYLVCNASNGFLGPFPEIRPEHWDRAFRTNVTGTYECAMRASQLMKARGGGAIVTLSTVASTRYLEGFGCQGVVKSAVEALTRYLACELGQHHIRANCVSAGPVYGELIEKFEGSSELIAHWESISPGGRLCAPEDVADVVAYLLGETAARITGAVWVVDNGVSGIIDGRVPRRTTFPSREAPPA